MNQETRIAYQERLEAQMREWKADMDKLKARADQIRAEGKIEFTSRLEELEEEGKRLQAKIRELQAAGGDAWGELKTGIEKSWQALRRGVQKIKEE